MVDAADSKSAALTGVRVRVSPRAPKSFISDGFYRFETHHLYIVITHVPFLCLLVYRKPLTKYATKGVFHASFNPLSY